MVGCLSISHYAYGVRWVGNWPAANVSDRRIFKQLGLSILNYFSNRVSLAWKKSVN